MNDYITANTTTRQGSAEWFLMRKFSLTLRNIIMLLFGASRDDLVLSLNRQNLMFNALNIIRIYLCVLHIDYDSDNNESNSDDDDDDNNDDFFHEINSVEHFITSIENKINNNNNDDNDDDDDDDGNGNGNGNGNDNGNINKTG